MSNYPLDRLEELDKQIAEKAPINHQTIDRALDALTGYFLTFMLKEEYRKNVASNELTAKAIADAMDPAFMLRMLIACKRGLVKKEAAAAAQAMLDRIGKEEPKG